LHSTARISATPASEATPQRLAKPLLCRFLRLYPFQPATAFFRSVEIAYVVAQDLPDGRGLDLGCGDGKLTRLILEHIGERRLVGIDPDPIEAALARETGIYERVDEVGAESIPAGNESFDFVFSNSVLEHVPPISEVLSETARVLRPGGKFIFTVPSESFHSCLRGPLLSRDRDRYLENLDRRVAHLRYWAPDRWASELEARGLTMESATRYLSRDEVRRWEILHRCTAGILFWLFRKRKHPIEIQSTLGMRSQSRSLPAFFARLLSRAFAADLDLARPPRPGEPSGCLLVVARK
jgi:SAM-dependent methyltransferase